MANCVLACGGLGGIGVFRDQVALAEIALVECESWFGTLATLAGGGTEGGTGGTGSLEAHTGGETSSHVTTSLCRRRIAMCYILPTETDFVLNVCRRARICVPATRRRLWWEPRRGARIRCLPT